MMTEFESLICRIRDMSKAINIHRTATHIERLNATKADLDYLLLDNSYYNAVLQYTKGNNAPLVDDESVVWHFRDAPQYAAEYLSSANLDGNHDEIALVSRWYRLARVRQRYISGVA